MLTKPPTKSHIRSQSVTRPAAPSQWRALIPLMLFVVCVLGANAPPNPFPISQDDPPPAGPSPLLCPSYNAETSPLPTADLTPVSQGAPPGTIAGAFSVSQAGEATYSIPLIVPPGRMGMEPRLAVAYSSSAGDGLLGAGFGLQGLSAITRCPSNLAQDRRLRAVRYDVEDNFCLDGMRLVETSSAPGVREFRTFPDTFRKIVAYVPDDWSAAKGPEHFEVFTKEGLIIHYGANAESRALATGGVIASWWMTTQRDRRNNTIEYKYDNITATSGDAHTLEIVPTRIEYAHNPGAGASRAVVISYQNIPPRVYWSGGMKLKRSKLVSQIRTEIYQGAATTVVRRYEFGYDPGNIPETGRRLLQSVEECTSVTACKPKTTFTWSTHFRSLTKDGERLRIFPYEHNFNRSNWLMADVNGDGLDDVVAWGPNDQDDSKIVWRVALNTGGEFAAAQTWIEFANTGDPSWSWAPTPMDYDQDGRADLVLDAPNFEGLAYLWLHAKPGGGFELLSTGIPHPTSVEIGSNEEITFRPEHHRFMRLGDVNGDGVADLIECVNPAWEVPAYDPPNPSLGSPHWTVRLWSPTGNGTGTGPGFNTAPISIPKYNGYDCAFGIKELYIVDVDGDGASEIMVPDYDVDCGCGSDPTCFCRHPYAAQRLGNVKCNTAADCSSGACTNGICEVPEWEALPTTGLLQQASWRKIHFFDMNADGLPDALYTAFTANESGVEVPAVYQWDPPLVAGDWNGNGLIDDVDPAGPWREGKELWSADLPVLAFNKGSSSFGVPTPALPHSLAGSGDSDLSILPTGVWTDVFGEKAMPIDYNGDVRLLQQRGGRHSRSPEQRVCAVRPVCA